MTETPAANAAQIDYWNHTMGPTWVALQSELERMVGPFGAAAMEALNPCPGEHILEIGCGGGQTTMALAERVGAAGAVLAVDISRPMLDAARRRVAPSGSATPEFRQADAQTADLGSGRFDAAFSRFGVMFFDDPPAAFANIRRALKPDGRLSFVCWRTPTENPWMTAPFEAAASLLPPQPRRDPTAPGPFAFADSARVHAILDQAGFRRIDVQPFDARIGQPGLDQAVAFALRVGPLSVALREHDGPTDQVVGAVRAALAPYASPPGVLLPAAVWIVTARA